MSNKQERSENGKSDSSCDSEDKGEVKTAASTEALQSPSVAATSAKMRDNSNRSEDPSRKSDDGEIGTDESSHEESSSAEKNPLHSRSDDPSSRISPSTDESNDDEKSKGEKKRKEKPKLRKGKWTAEEEAFTTRIIHHYNSGLLTLPEGATLRSYLADKLNCDPMRITKKFNGQCCSGRRVFNLRDRPRASKADIEMAKAELDHLEQLFRMRVEQEQSGLPMTRRPPTGQSGVSTIFPIQNRAAATVTSPWIRNYTGAGVTLNPTLGIGRPGNSSLQNPLSSQFPLGSLSSSAAPWLLPNTPEQPPQSDASVQYLNLIKSLTWIQAAASLAPTMAASLPPTAAVSQLAFPTAASVPINTASLHQLQNLNISLQQAEELKRHQQQAEHQRQLRSAYEESKKQDGLRDTREDEKSQESKAKSSQSTSSEEAKSATPTAKKITAADLLQRSYEAHLQSLKQYDDTSPKEEAVANDRKEETPKIPPRIKESSETFEDKNKSTGKKSTQDPEDKSATTQAEMKGKKRRNQKIKSSSTNQSQKAGEQSSVDRKEEKIEDEEAGSILLLLRKSYEDAVEEKICSSRTQNDSDEEKAKKGEKRLAKSISESSSTSTTNLKAKIKPTTKTLSKQKKRRTTAGQGADEREKVQVTSGPRFRTSSSSNGRVQTRPASVTDTSTLSRSETSSGSSSQPNEFSSSSLEDSDSKSDKTDPSSSEESERESGSNMTSKGPPRKRLKSYKNVKEFTTKNLREHSERMEQDFVESD